MFLGNISVLSGGMLKDRQLGSKILKHTVKTCLFLVRYLEDPIQTLRYTEHT